MAVILPVKWRDVEFRIVAYSIFNVDPAVGLFAVDNVWSSASGMKVFALAGISTPIGLFGRRGRTVREILAEAAERNGLPVMYLGNVKYMLLIRLGDQGGWFYVDQNDLYRCLSGMYEGPVKVLRPKYFMVSEDGRTGAPDARAIIVHWWHDHEGRTVDKYLLIDQTFTPEMKAAHPDLEELVTYLSLGEDDRARAEEVWRRTGSWPWQLEAGR